MQTEFGVFPITNNQIYKKIRAAIKGLSWSNDKIDRLFKLGGQSLSKRQIQAVGRGSDSKNYKTLRSHELEAFLNGLVKMSKQITLNIPVDFDFNQLNLSRDPVTHDIDFDTAPIVKILELSGIDAMTEFTEDQVSEILLGLYRLHTEAGGEKNQVVEQIISEIHLEDEFCEFNIIQSPGSKQ